MANRVSEGMNLNGNHRDTGIPMLIPRIGNLGGVLKISEGVTSKVSEGEQATAQQYKTRKPIQAYIVVPWFALPRLVFDLSSSSLRFILKFVSI